MNHNPISTVPPSNPDSAVARILDANANRASEGLRVVEDYLRFARNDRNSAQICKGLRHRLATLLAQLPASLLLAARNVPSDVGRTTQTDEEYVRESPEAVALANIKRVQQALRSLEEFGKIVSPSWAVECETIRYESYELEQAVLRGGQSTTAPIGSLCVLIAPSHSPADFAERVKRLTDAGVPLLQLRMKDATDSQLLDCAELLLRATEPTETRVVINDRPDVALAVGAQGVHVGQDDLPLDTARKVVGTDAWVGVSTHCLPQAQAAEAGGADYIGVGPTFPSTTKSFDKFPGPTLLTQTATQISVPAFAIGGIQLENLHLVLATGIRRVAVASAIWNAERPEVAAQEFLRRLQND